MLPHSTPSAPCVKTCTKCGEIKPATTEYFGLKKKGHDELRSSCKDCERAYRASIKVRSAEYNRAYYATNKDRLSEYGRVYHASHKQGDNDRSKKNRIANPGLRRAYRLANLEREKMNQRQWSAANLEHRKEYNRAYYASNAQANRDRAKKWYADNQDRAKENIRKWRAVNPDARRMQERVRRARERGASGSHSSEDVLRQYKAQKGKCYYCHSKVGDKYHVDHVVPLSRGGSNGPENLVIACPQCNQSKRDKLPHEWPKGGRLL